MVLKASTELVQAIHQYLEGDKSAFDVIYHESVKYVTCCVLNVLNRTAPGTSQDLQQDIIQDTYLTISAKLETLQNPELFLQWAGQIATRHALRTWKRDTKLHMTEVETSEEIEDFADESFIPEDILWNKEKRKMVRDMLDELPTNQYLCVVEYFYNGLKEKEVAEKLGIPVNTVKTNLSRAKKKLRTIVEAKEKKSGVRLYSMGGLLLVMLWNESLTVSAATVQDAIVLEAVHAQISGGSAAASAGAACATEGTAVTAGTTATAGLTAKAVGAAIAAVVAIGSIAMTLNQADIPEDAFRFENHSYYIMSESCETWEDARAYCESVGGYLAVITSEEENAALYGYLQENGIGSAYFGLYLDETDGIWKWVNGESTVYQNWNPGEPNNERGTERYAMFYHKFKNGTWNDGGYGNGTVGDTMVFLCEWDK